MEEVWAAACSAQGKASLGAVELGLRNLSLMIENGWGAALRMLVDEKLKVCL